MAKVQVAYIVPSLKLIKLKIAYVLFSKSVKAIFYLKLLEN